MEEKSTSQNINLLYDYYDSKVINEDFNFIVTGLDNDLIEKDETIKQLENNKNSYLLKIHELNKKIKEKTDETRKQADELEKQSDVIKKQSDAMKKQSDEMKKQSDEIDKFIENERNTMAMQTAEITLREQLTVIFNKACINDKFNYTENLLKSFCDKIKKERNAKFIRPFRRNFVERARMYACRLYFTDTAELTDHEIELKKLTKKYIELNLKYHVNIVKYSESLKLVKILDYQYYEILDKMLKLYNPENF